METMCTLPGALWTNLLIGFWASVASVETSTTTGLIYFVWLYMSQSQALIQA